MNTTNGLHNTNISCIAPLPTPAELKQKHPLDDFAYSVVRDTREQIARILLGEDSRLLVVVGPCSIHNVNETLEYAQGLASLSKELKDRLLIVMRFCGDKPRTRRDWTGFWNDPRMDGSCDIATGWNEGRKLAVEILKLGLPLGCEFLDAENFQRFDDTLSYVWLGARDVGSQRQRQIASGISTPVGFKNHNVGGTKIALDALSVSVAGNVFVASNDDGRSSRFATTGNRLSHLIHRGTESGPNYDAESIAASVQELTHRAFVKRVMVDVSHGNSQKDYRRQRVVIDDVVSQVISGSQSIAGIMYESYLYGDKQAIPRDLSKLRPKVSVTDGCDSWPDTIATLRLAHERLSAPRLGQPA